MPTLAETTCCTGLSVQDETHDVLQHGGYKSWYGQRFQYSFASENSNFHLYPDKLPLSLVEEQDSLLNNQLQTAHERNLREEHTSMFLSASKSSQVNNYDHQS
jgi:hypothetical protein